MIYEKYRKLGWYHWDNYARDADYRNFVDFTIEEFPKKGTALDLGCGDGLYSFLLSRRGLDITGVDNNDFGISLAKRRTKSDKGLKFYVSDLEFLADYDVKWKFDYCLSCFIIEHITKKGVIEKIFEKYVKKYMILVTDNAKSRTTLGRYHYKLYTTEDIKKMFKEYKVNIVMENVNHFIAKIEK